MPNITKLQADIDLDLRGESCPFPLMHTLDALANAQKGNLLRVTTDCPSSFRNIPSEMQKRQFQFAQAPEKVGAEYVFYIYA